MHAVEASLSCLSASTTDVSLSLKRHTLAVSASHLSADFCSIQLDKPEDIQEYSPLHYLHTKSPFDCCLRFLDGTIRFQSV